MERIIQYLDDLEDTVFALLLMSEVIRRVARSALHGTLMITAGLAALVLSSGHIVGSLVLLNVLVLALLYASLARDRMLSVVSGT